MSAGIAQTLGEYRDLARKHGEPTMGLMFEKGKLFQMYKLRVNPNESAINVWVPIEGQEQENGEAS